MDHQHNQEQLNAYAENLLSDRDRGTIEAHLKTCSSCTDELAALTSLLDQAAELPPSLEPERDLWPTLSARLEPKKQEEAGKGWQRWFTGWEPLAAAAALAVVVTGVVLLTQRGPVELAGDETILPPGPEAMTVLSDEGDRQSAVVAQMIWALESESLGAGKILMASLQKDPRAFSENGLQAIDQSLRVLDRAIDESATALRADPENPKLVRRLTGYYQQRLSILRKATRLANRV